MPYLNGESLNIEDSNIKKLVELFPEVNTDGKIDFEKLKQILGDYIDDSEERYRFGWNGKGEALRISQTPSMGTLRPAKEDNESKNWEETENLYIEGDNLEVLKLLQKSYFNKVKMIYIDPPYNTGGDFVYKDNFKDNIQNYKKITGQVDSEGNTTTTNKEYSGRYHTDWLNMMYPRLRLARNLLTDDGIIFISIDDNEVNNLRKICDEVMGEENALIPFIWELPRGINAGLIARSHEYIIGYAKDRSKINNFYSLLDNKYSIDRCNKKIDERHPESIIEFPAGIKYIGEDKVLTDVIEGSEKLTIHGEMVFRNGLLQKPVSISAGWTMKNMILDWLDGKEVYDSKGQKIVEFFFKENGKLYSKKEVTTISIKSVLKNIPDTQIARKEMENLFGSQDIFPYPKTKELNKLLGKLCTKENDIIMDFFSGSSTTAHATIELNAEDNSNRKFIMIQLPEPIKKNSEAYKVGYENIADIGKQRIRRAGEKIKKELKEKYNVSSEEKRNEMKLLEDFDIGFKVFKLDSSNIKAWNPGEYTDIQTAIEDFEAPYVPGRTEEDVVYEMMLKMGLDLTYPVEEIEVNGKIIYSIGYGFLMICLADSIDIAVAEKMIEIREENNQQEFRAIFRDEGFNSDESKTNVKETLRSAGLAEESFITL